MTSLTKWMHKNFDGAKVNFNDVSMLVVTHTRVFVIEGMYVFESSGTEAIGSGAPWAEGYLRAYPDDLKGSIEAACYFDPYTAGPVQGPFTV